MTGIRRLKEIERFDREVDVLVMGLGLAGASAALEAKAAGRDVLVVERSRAVPRRSRAASSTWAGARRSKRRRASKTVKRTCSGS